MNKRPTDRQQAIWKTYAELVQNSDYTLGDADGRHELHQIEAIKQIALATDKPIDEIRKDLICVCEWLKGCFAK